MKIHSSRNRAMALLSLILLTAIFIVFIAGLCYLIYKVCRWSDRIGHSGNGGSIVEVQSLDGEESAQPPPEAIYVPVGNTNEGVVLRFTVETSTNLFEWYPLTNFLCAPDQFWKEWKMPIDITEPQRFFRVEASDPRMGP